MNSIEKPIPSSLIVCLFFRWLMMSISSISCATAHAEDISKFWERVETQLHKNSGLAAIEISSSFEVPGDNHPLAGMYNTRVRQWDNNGIPTRPLLGSDEASMRAYRMATLDLALATRFADRPEYLFQAPDSITSLGETTVEGRVFSVCQIHSRFVNGRLPITANIWFDLANGTVEKVVGTLEKVDLPGVKTVNFSLIYRTDSEGRSLPAILKVDYTISIFFHTGKVAFSQEFHDWAPRPSQ